MLGATKLEAGGRLVGGVHALLGLGRLNQAQGADLVPIPVSSKKRDSTPRTHRAGWARGSQRVGAEAGETQKEACFPAPGLFSHRVRCRLRRKWIP